MTGQYKASWYAVAGPNGDLTWRVDSPAKAIAAKVCKIPDKNGFAHLYWPNTSKDFPWYFDLTFEDGSTERVRSRKRWEALCEQRARVTNREIVYPLQEGSAAVWTRPLSFQAAHMLELKQQGVRTVSEVDDNYLSAEKLNVFMKKAGWGENDRDNHARSISTSDGLIVSTEYLRDVYLKGLREMFGKKLVPEIFVCRNHIDEQSFVERIPERKDGRLRIGYMGSDSHIWDVDLIYDALLTAYRMGHEIVFIGIGPGVVAERLGQKKSRKKWSEIPYTHIPWQNDGFRGMALPLDIGFAPLIIDQHTSGKSDIKWMEYAMSGAATIAQNSVVYNKTLVHGETGLLAGSPAEFTARMLTLIADDDIRERLVTNTKQYITDNRLLANNKKEWEDAVYG